MFLVCHYGGKMVIKMINILLLLGCLKQNVSTLLSFANTGTAMQKLRKTKISYSAIADAIFSW